MRNCLIRGGVVLLTMLGAAAVPIAARAQGNALPSLVVSSSHSDTIRSIAFSSDGRWLASSSADSTIKIWDSHTGRLLRSLIGHTSGVSAIAISRDGKRVASVSDNTDKRAIIWNPVTGEPLVVIPNIAPGQNDAAEEGIAFSHDGQSIITVSYEAIRRWDVATGKLMRSFPRQQRQGQFNIWHRFAISADDRQMVAADSSQLLLLEAATGRVVKSLGSHPLKTYNGVTYPELSRSIVFSPDGELVAAHYQDIVKVYAVKSGRILHDFNLLANAVAFAQDSKRIAFATYAGVGTQRQGTAGLQLWDVYSRHLVRTLAEGQWQSAVAFSPDGSSVVAGSSDMTAWEVATGSPLPWIVNPAGSVTIAAHSDDYWLVAGPSGFATWNAASGQVQRIVPRTDVMPQPRIALDATGRALVAAYDGLAIKIWNVVDGALVRTVEWHPKPSAERPCPACAPYSINLPTLSPDGRWLAAYLWGDKSSIRIWDVSSGSLLQTIPSFVAKDTNVYMAANDLVFSADGRLLYVGTQEMYDSKEGVSKNSVRIWDVATGTLLRTLALPYKKELPYAPSPNLKTLSLVTDGVKAVSSNARWLVTGADSWVGRDGDWRTSIALLEVGSGKLLREFPADTSRVAVAAFSKGDQSILVGFQRSPRIKIFEAASGKLFRVLEGNPGNPYSLTQSPDGRRAIAGNLNGTSAVWDIENGQLLAFSLHPRSGEWLTMTPEGFFAASSPKAGSALSIVRGFELFTVDQIYQALFNPDLVREKLADDPHGEVKKAASVLDLAKLLGSGQSPQVILTNPLAQVDSTEELVNAEAMITDQGGGIGRIEWRLNGVTVGVASAEPSVGKQHRIGRRLSLEPGENTIEVVAYNGANLLASRAATGTVIYKGPADTAKPNLHVLAVGINDYTDTGWVPPGSTEAIVFGKLGLAVRDATTFAAALKKAAVGRYGDVRVTLALDGDATADNLERIIERLAGEVHPRDTFVLFAAAHGISEGGRFYLIPQDYQGGPGSLAKMAIGQDRLQDWIANRLQAKKVLILLDTCESGALVSGSGRSRTDTATSEAAIGRLHEATGRPVLTAAAEGKPAFEGYESHGVFTWAVLDALRNGDRNGNGSIELSELVAHVQDQVPKISAKLNGRGRAAVAARGAAEDRQSARFGSRGEDFVLVDRLQ